MVETKLEVKQLRSKFVRDFQLPIQVVQSPYFENTIRLLEDDCGAQTKYADLLALIQDKFDGNVGKFFEYRNKVANDILSYINNSEAYKEFLADKTVLEDYKPIVASRELYTQEQSGHCFISYDMIKANFQALRYANPAIVKDCKTYEEFVGKFTDIDYFAHAKQLRQETFGKLNGKRTAAIEKRVSNEFAKALSERLGDRFTLFSIKTDEIIFKFNGTEEEFKKLDFANETFDGFDFRVNQFKLTHREFKRHTSDSKIVAFIKEDFKANRRSLHCVPDTYYPQVYKLLNGIKIDYSDLVFYFDHELSKFLYPLELV